MQRRQCAASLLALGAIPCTSLAQTQLRARPIRLVVPFGPGGVADLTVRIVSRAMSEMLGGPPIVVDNRPGAGGVSAAEHVARAAPDGQVLLLMSNANAVAEGLFPSLPCNTVRDFSPISLLGRFDLAMLVAHTSSLQSFQGLLARARYEPGQLNIGTLYSGSTQHLAAELLKTTLGLDVQLVPYNSSAALFHALRGRQVDAAVDMLAPVMAPIESRQLRALVVMGDRRAAVLPGVQTVSESEAAAAGFGVSSWNGLAAPANTDPATIARLCKAANAALASADVAERLQRLGVVAEGSTPAEMATLLQREIQRWAGVMERAGIGRI